MAAKGRRVLLSPYLTGKLFSKSDFADTNLDEDVRDELRHLRAEELAELIEDAERQEVAKRSLDYLYGGVRYRKRSIV